jgi:hypothetical protein
VFVVYDCGPYAFRVKSFSPHVIECYASNEHDMSSLAYAKRGAGVAYPVLRRAKGRPRERDSSPLFAVSRPTLEPIQWILGALSLGVTQL